MLTDNHNYYRLKIIDLDGRHKFSKVVILNAELLGDRISVFPNPARNVVAITHPKAGKAALIIVTSVNGLQVMSHRVVPEAVQTTVDLGRYPSGNYILTYSNEGKNEQVKITKQ